MSDHPHPPGPPIQPAGPRWAPSNATIVLLTVLGTLTLLVCGACCNLALDHYGLLPATETEWETEDEPDMPLVRDLPSEPATPAPSAPVPSWSPSPQIGPTGTRERRTRVITYEVTGDGPADILYADEEGRVIELTDQRLPWRKKLVAVPSTRPMVVARRWGPAVGDIRCRVTAGGRTPVEVHNRGSWSGATCIDAGATETAGKRLG